MSTNLSSFVWLSFAVAKVMLFSENSDIFLLLCKKNNAAALVVIRKKRIFAAP
jgi:hypothetical protein